MSVFLADEGEALNASQVMMNVTTDRGTDLEMGLFTDATPSDTITEATISEPTGGSYARKTLTDASWTGSADARSYAEQTFTATGSAYSGSVYGYFIATKGTTPRLIAVEIDASGPYTMAENDTYAITPTITLANA